MGLVTYPFGLPWCIVSTLVSVSIKFKESSARCHLET